MSITLEAFFIDNNFIAQKLLSVEENKCIRYQSKFYNLYVFILINQSQLIICMKYVEVNGKQGHHISITFTVKKYKLNN